MDAIIKPANSDDAPAIADVYLSSRRLFIESYAPMMHNELDVRKWVARQLIPTANVWVAELDGSVVGFMATMSDRAFDWIEHLYLIPSAVGGGIGSQFVNLAKTESCRPIRLYTFQANQRSRQFYERHGFRPIKFSAGQSNEEQCPDVLYEWSDEAAN